jgi:hypothetical protein
MKDERKKLNPIPLLILRRSSFSLLPLSLSEGNDVPP